MQGMECIGEGDVQQPLPPQIQLSKKEKSEKEKKRKRGERRKKEKKGNIKKREEMSNNHLQLSKTSPFWQCVYSATVFLFPKIFAIFALFFITDCAELLGESSPVE